MIWLLCPYLTPVLIKNGFQYLTCLVNLMYIMLVWRIARPVPAGCVNFHNDEPMTRETWRNNVVNLPRSIIATPDLDLDVRWSDQAWFMILISWCLRHSYLAGSLSSHR